MKPKTGISIEACAAATSTTSEESLLMPRIAAGDTGAFAVFLDRYMTPVFRFCYSYLKDERHAEDVTQETFFRLWRNAGDWKPSGNAYGWLLRIARNLCIDEIRRRRPQIDIHGTEDILPSLPPVQEEIVNDADVAHAMEKALFQLPERQHEALSLVYYQELTNPEAAGVMGVSVDAFESLLARGKRGLKKALKDIKSGLMEG